MSLFTSLYGELTTEVIRLISGRLFTEKQIKEITSHAAGKYLADFFPEPEGEKIAKARVEEAKEHITLAGKIIHEMQSDLEVKTKNLDGLIKEIETKKELANRYAMLANTNKEQFDAFKQEIEETLRDELVKQSSEGKGLRRFVSFVIWSGTLAVGAIISHYYVTIETFIKGLFP